MEKKSHISPLNLIAGAFKDVILSAVDASQRGASPQSKDPCHLTIPDYCTMDSVNALATTRDAKP
jgi:hypothetical protein